jgi:hypothetical protein
MSFAKALERAYPKYQNFLEDRYNEQAAEETAAGQMAEQQIDPALQLEANRDGWQKLISDVRSRDRERGTDQATELVGASPHFRRGLVQARTKRLGLGLRAHLNNQWQQNDGGIKDVDDPAAVQNWLQEQTNAYTERVGISGIDPVILAENYTPYLATAQEQLLSNHMSYRSRARVEEFSRELSSGVGLALTGGGNASSSVGRFINRLAGAESGGDYRIVNDEGYTGLLQFGQARLDDYNRATGSNISLEQFRTTNAIQNMVNIWHVQDIDRHIDANGYIEQGYSRDGLRAIAHLGGYGGLDSWVASGGSHDPADSNGTNLSDYYRRFSGAPTTEIQSQADQAVRNGVNPTDVNKTVVNSIVAQALEMGNPAALAILDEIDTGNGPLGNIGWVREARTQAEDRIEQNRYDDERRARAMEQWEREDQTRRIQTEAYQEIINNPYADHRQHVQRALDAGLPQLATTIRSLSDAQLDRANEPSNDPTSIMEAERLVRDLGVSYDEKVDQITGLATSRVISTGTAQSLMDELDDVEPNLERARLPGVREEISLMMDTIETNTEFQDWITGEVVVNGGEVALRARDEAMDELLVFLEANPDSSKAEVRRATRNITREVLRKPEYQLRRPTGEGAAPAQPEQTNRTPQGASNTPGNSGSLSNEGQGSDASAAAVATGEDDAPSDALTPILQDTFAPSRGIMVTAYELYSERNPDTERSLEDFAQTVVQARRREAYEGYKQRTGRENLTFEQWEEMVAASTHTEPE